jgi:cyclophilin family peptidyl-prolyl cis-trans isomerase
LSVLWISLSSALGLVAAAIARKSPNPRVLMKTSLGDVTIELFPNEAPVTVQNFLAYADAAFFDGTIFHRVIDGFMIQGGGMTADMKEKPASSPIRNEADNGLKNARCTLAMARRPDIHSASSQFFINLVDNPFLDHQAPAPDKFGYAVFGKVVAGMEVVDAIARVATGTRGMHQDVPREPVAILSMTRLEAE